MKSLFEGVPAPLEFDAAIDAARDTLRLGVAYHLAHHRLALADVVVRAAVAFTEQTDAELSETALENLFDAVKNYRVSIDT